MALLAGCPLLVFTGSATAQLWTNQPSANGPSQVLTDTFRTLSRLTPAGSIPQLPRGARPGDVSTLGTPLNFSMQVGAGSTLRRSGRAGVGYGSGFAPSSPQPTGTSLFGRRYYSGSGLGSLGSWGGGSAYPPLTRDNPGLLMRRPDLPMLPSPRLAAVAIHENAASSQPAEAIPLQRDPVPIESLVKEYIDGRRAGFMEQGWQKFREGQYRAAGDLFALAASVCTDDPAPRAEVEVARIFPAIATKQYSVAAGALRWLLTPNRRTGELPDPQFLTTLDQIESRYGQKTDFQLHFRELEAIAIANPDVVEYQALRSIFLLARRDEVAASFYARSIAATVHHPWPSLAPLIERTVSRGTNASPAATRPSASAEKPILLPDLDVLATQR